MNLKISVITVTRNSKSVIKNCLYSVATQSHGNIEHIVIDGASTDGTLEVLQTHHSSFASFISEEDNGIYDAMNKGINASSGEVIGFLNSDDFFAHKDVLATVAQCFKEDPNLEACYSDLAYVDQRDLSRTIRYWKSNTFLAGSFSKGWMPPHPTFYVRRSVYEQFSNFDLNYRIAADVELMMRFLEVHKINTRYVPNIWVMMRMGGITNNSFRNIWLQNQEVIQALKMHNLSVNTVSFFLNKVMSRAKQYC